MSTKLLKTGAASLAHDNGYSSADVDVPVLMVDRLATLSNLVSRGLARLYSVRFGLTVSDWRVLAVISRYPGVSSNAVCELAAMDKVRVSRAVSRLLELERIDRRSDKRDRRRSELYATEEGLEIYSQVVPVARAYEAKLLAGLSAEESHLLRSLLATLEGAANGIAREGFGMAVGLDTRTHVKQR
ncbi:MAG: MarR family winged helix-turn-helix transcriptional regulator [Proteobacteria bacterium]|nr:MarR family winged helix-turn-helix transcriptional regulator [Pseudomonadota bacterium]MDA1355131.1 MarR family winged helix-turn-helix transcriptional regulator [Pseudomonadota bacterium]